VNRLKKEGDKGTPTDDPKGERAKGAAQASPKDAAKASVAGTKDADADDAVLAWKEGGDGGDVDAGDSNAVVARDSVGELGGGEGEREGDHALVSTGSGSTPAAAGMDQRAAGEAFSADALPGHVHEPESQPPQKPPKRGGDSGTELRAMSPNGSVRSKAGLWISLDEPEPPALGESADAGAADGVEGGQAAGEAPKGGTGGPVAEAVEELKADDELLGDGKGADADGDAAEGKVKGNGGQKAAEKKKEDAKEAEAAWKALEKRLEVRGLGTGAACWGDPLHVRLGVGSLPCRRPLARALHVRRCLTAAALLLLPPRSTRTASHPSTCVTVTASRSNCQVTRPARDPFKPMFVITLAGWKLVTLFRRERHASSLLISSRSLATPAPRRRRGRCSGGVTDGTGADAPGVA
jgi:hypothetical protein